LVLPTEKTPGAMRHPRRHETFHLGMSQPL
jgi:hypothetical protein